jgi:hypothetical protein
LGSDISGVTGFGITAQHHPQDHIFDIGALVSRDFVFQPQITPPFPMVAKNLPQAVGVRWTIRAKGEGEDHRSAT